MKKSLLAFGTILATSAPIAGAMSCTLIKKDQIENYTEFKKMRTIEEIISTFDETNGANIGVTPWLSSFWKQRSNKLLGALNYKTNNNGVIASNGFDLEDVRSLSRLFEAQSWLEFGGYNVKSIKGEDPSVEDIKKYDMRLNKNGEVIKNIGLGDLHAYSWLSEFNINNGQTYKENDSLRAFVNGQLKEFKAWNTDNTEGTFIHSKTNTGETTNVFQVSTRDKNIGDGFNHSKTEYEEIRHFFGLYDDEELSSQDIKEFVQTQIGRLVGNTSEWKKYKFVPKLMGTKINFYIAYNIHANEDAALYNKEDITISSSSNFSTIKEKVEKWFESFGIGVNVINVPLDGEGDDSKSSVVITSADTPDPTKWGKPFDTRMLTEIVNSNKKALVYMPVDSWLSSGDPKGSLLLQKRSVKTVGDDVFYLEDEQKDPITVNEPKLIEQMEEIYASFSDFTKSDNYSLLNFFDTVTNATTDAQLPNRDGLIQANKELGALHDMHLEDAKTFLTSKSISFDEAVLTNNQIIELARTNGYDDKTILLQIQIAERKVADENDKWLKQQQDVLDWINRSISLTTNPYLSNWIDTKIDKNIFRDKSKAYRESMKTLPVIDKVTGNVDYRIKEYYTAYNTQYIFSPDIGLRNAAQRYFSQVLDAESPRASNNFSWTINSRNSLPLPITIGYTNDDDHAMKPNILDWVREHFVI